MIAHNCKSKTILGILLFLFFPIKTNFTHDFVQNSNEFIQNANEFIDNHVPTSPYLILGLVGTLCASLIIHVWQAIQYANTEDYYKTHINEIQDKFNKLKNCYKEVDTTNDVDQLKVENLQLLTENIRLKELLLKSQTTMEQVLKQHDPSEDSFSNESYD